MEKRLEKMLRDGRKLEILWDAEAGNGYGQWVCRIDGAESIRGEIMDWRGTRAACKLPIGCSHILGGKIALVASEGEALMEFAAAHRAAHAEKRFAAIPGLAALRAARAAADRERERYHDDLDRMMHSGDGCGPKPRDPKIIEAAELAARQFPAAMAYLRAEAFSRAANSYKIAAGKRAMIRIEAGEDAAKVMAEMDAEWSAAAQRANEAL